VRSRHVGWVEVRCGRGGDGSGGCLSSFHLIVLGILGSSSLLRQRGHHHRRLMWCLKSLLLDLDGRCPRTCRGNYGFSRWKTRCQAWYEAEDVGREQSGRSSSFLRDLTSLIGGEMEIVSDSSIGKDETPRGSGSSSGMREIPRCFRCGAEQRSTRVNNGTGSPCHYLSTATNR
jgi:hypothetical protein